MALETRRIAFESPELQELLDAFHQKWNINPATYAAPTHWVAKTDGSTLFAAVGFTISPDRSVVYVADLLCQPTKPGIRALVDLVREFTETAYRDERIKSVCAQALFNNDTMRRFIEKAGLKPLSVVYGVTREQYERDRIEHGRR